MKQILQHLNTGVIELAEVPRPRVGTGQLLICTTRSLISAGTERMLLDFGRANLIDKARQQPDKVRVVWEKVKTDGLMPTIDAVRNKLDQPIPLGYCNVGRVLEVGRSVEGFSVGARVASAGKHAEIVAVPVNLSAHIPIGVSDEEAAFTVVGAIALQGIRLAQPTLGEAVVVTGLGLIGQITVQLLRAHGCRVMGIDPDPARLELARTFGAEVVSLASGGDPIADSQRFSRGRGVDAVIVTAATPSSEPIHQAAAMSRQRGRIVLVGVTGLELSRDDFYRKELSFQVSCSYGPGRYDADYEEKGLDYPVGYVRWTEQRNFEAVLDMLADGRLDVKPLISHRVQLERAADAYAVVGGIEPSMAILLEYPTSPNNLDPAISASSVAFSQQPGLRTSPGRPGIGVIGSGNYATAVLIPAFKSAGARLISVASRSGVSGVHAGRKYGFEETTTDADSIFKNEAVTAVVVTTRHDSHAEFALEAIAARKHVFVEKPLCLTLEELAEIQGAYGRAADAGRAPILMVGFNRRFARHSQEMKTLLGGLTTPKSIVMTVNAGSIPADHWTQDPKVGGGRMIGEACHFIDLLRFLIGHPIVSHSRSVMNSRTRDTQSLQFVFADGSIGTVHYFANGSKAVPKERLEVFADGRVLQLDNFRVLHGSGWPGLKTMRLWRQDKGQKACAAAFVQAIVRGGEPPIPFEEILEVSRVTIELATDR